MSFRGRNDKNNKTKRTMKTANIIRSEKFGSFRIDVTKSSDSYNALIYKGDGIENLVGCVAIGIHQNIDEIFEKAKVKLSTLNLNF